MLKQCFSHQSVKKEILQNSSFEIYWKIHNEKQTLNADRDRARSLVFVKREEALRNAGQIEFHGALQLAHEKQRPDSTVASFEHLQIPISILHIWNRFFQMKGEIKGRCFQLFMHSNYSFFQEFNIQVF